MWRVCCAQMGSCCSGVFLLRSGPCCEARVLWVLGACLRGVFRVSASDFPVCYEVDNSPLFNFNRIFSPFPGACRNLAQKPLI